MDVIANRFEVGRSSTGLAAMQAWIAAQITAGNATHVLTTISNKSFDQEFITVLLATTMTKDITHTVGSNVLTGQFALRNDYTKLVAFLNNALAGVSAPSNPSLSTVVAGALTGQGTMSVKLTYVSAAGESAASGNTTQAVPDNSELVVASPAAYTSPSGIVTTGYNVYIGVVGSEKKQNSSPIALGTNYTQSAAVNTGSALASATNATAAKYLQLLEVFDRYPDTQVVAVASN